MCKTYENFQTVNLVLQKWDLWVPVDKFFEDWLLQVGCPWCAGVTTNVEQWVTERNGNRHPQRIDFFIATPIPSADVAVIIGSTAGSVSSQSFMSMLVSQPE